MKTSNLSFRLAIGLIVLSCLMSLIAIFISVGVFQLMAAIFNIFAICSLVNYNRQCENQQ